MSIQMTPRSTWTADETRRLHDLAERGYTDEEIADILGRSLSSVQCKRRRQGSVRARGGALKAERPVKPCMRCRVHFRPEHRYNYICTRCNGEIAEIGLPWAA